MASEWERESITRWAHQGLGGRWWLALLLIPLLLAVLTTFVRGDDIEAELESRTVSALNAKGITGATVEADGVDVTVTLPDQLPEGMDRGDAQAAVDSVDGIHESELVGGSTGTGLPPANPTAPPPAAGGNCDQVQEQVDAFLGANRAHFAAGSAQLSGAELAQVQQAGTLLAGCADSVVVSGHNYLGESPDDSLSQGRADAVADVLRTTGVTVAEAEGVGPADPIGDNATQDGRALNQYADIKVQ